MRSRANVQIACVLTKDGSKRPPQRPERLRLAGQPSRRNQIRVHFVGEYPWVHMDIAGTAWTDAKPKSYTPKGATGVGVRLLVQALRTWAEER